MRNYGRYLSFCLFLVTILVNPSSASEHHTEYLLDAKALELPSSGVAIRFAPKTMGCFSAGVTSWPFEIQKTNDGDTVRTGVNFATGLGLYSSYKIAGPVSLSTYGGLHWGIGYNFANLGVGPDFVMDRFVVRASFEYLFSRETEIYDGSGDPAGPAISLQIGYRAADRSRTLQATGASLSLLGAGIIMFFHWLYNVGD